MQLHTYTYTCRDEIYLHRCSMTFKLTIYMFFIYNYKSCIC